MPTVRTAANTHAIWNFGASGSFGVPINTAGSFIGFDHVNPHVPPEYSYSRIFEAPGTTLEEAPWHARIDIEEAAAGGPVDYAQPIDDTVSVADSLSTVATYQRDLADSVTPSDAVSFARDVHLADTVSLSDSATPQSGKEALIADTVSLSDSLSSTSAYARSVADSVTPSDSLSSASVYVRTIGDTLSLPSDSLSSSTAYVRAIDDTLALPSDVCTPVKGAGGVDWAQPIADTLTLADSLSSTSTYVLGVADTVTLSDALASSAVYLRALADTLSLADSLSAQLETISEGYPGPFDAGTETGRGSVSARDDDFVTVPGGRTRARALSADFTSTQRGKIGVS